jgi:hypothetical protein
MRPFHTSIVEFRRTFTDRIETFPMEAGWAAEAIFFVTAERDTPENALVTLGVQLSADGIRWVDEGSVLTFTGPGERFLRVSHFGGFLRLAGAVTAPDDPRCTLTVRLALKG